ncbi:hypothetical protein [Mesorhizobium sp. GR13]|uniref:Uncharacterized protein n=2 Tax=Mesorhizobium denitrificans TaxID=2294114 RepID=A0A371XE79_9HYPH|nr:hypothetical protein [Mesorhizobium sp. GR13]RFC67516.1 hypothetical protein DY251_10995 [Mesorhizobium denitrificans]
MEPYNFWQDFFATFRSSPDAIKALWLIAPTIFAAAIARIVSKSPSWTAGGRSISKISPDPSDTGHTDQNRKGEEVLVFVDGRLLDRFDIPEKSHNDAKRLARNANQAATADYGRHR